jgi:hypothetical protein
MGVPKFYRWLSERAPLINQAIDDETLLPETDNLYLDLNGLIHNATHGDGASRKISMADVMMAVIGGIDHSVKLVSGLLLLGSGRLPRARLTTGHGGCPPGHGMFPALSCLFVQPPVCRALVPSAPPVPPARRSSRASCCTLPSTASRRAPR